VRIKWTYSFRFYYIIYWNMFLRGFSHQISVAWFLPISRKSTKFGIAHYFHKNIITCYQEWCQVCFLNPCFIKYRRFSTFMRIIGIYSWILPLLFAPTWKLCRSVLVYDQYIYSAQYIVRKVLIPCIR
jgi:hypothetical protein